METSGYQEIEHTADLELKVWAPSYEQLLIEAAKGMYSLMEIKCISDNIQQREVSIDAIDKEMLLVSFLSELLFFLEEENLIFTKFSLIIKDCKLVAVLDGETVTSKCKEIKAVTYHNLKIRVNKGIFTAHIVFDV